MWCVHMYIYTIQTFITASLPAANTNSACN
jgi:hypothetical protein